MAIFWLYLLISPAAAQVVHQWTRQHRGDRHDVATSLQVDVNGNALVAGWTESSLDGNANKGFQDIFLMKFDARGVHLWTRQWGGEGSDSANALQVDSVGNALVAGCTKSSLDGNANAGWKDMFLMKFDAQGVHLWTRQRGNESSDEATALQVDANGNAWVAGFTYGSLDGNNHAGTTDWKDIFLMKFDAQGVHQWTRQRGDQWDDEASSLQVDAEGNAWVAGWTNSYHLDGQHRQVDTEEDVFLMKFDSQGVHQWTRVRGGEGNDRATALQVDDEGNALVAGYTESSRLDGHFTLLFMGGFLMKFNARGVHQWTRVHSGARTIALQVDKTSHAWVAGCTNRRNCDVFLMKLDAQGVHQWTRQRGGEGYDRAYTLKVDPTGHDVWVAGSTESSLDGHSHAGQRDIFLMRFQAECSQATCPAGYARSISQKSGGNSMCCVLSSTSTSTWTSSTTASPSITTTVSSTTRSTSITRTISSTTASTRTTSRTVSSTRSTTKASSTTTSMTVPSRTSTPTTTKTSTRTTSRTVSTRTSTPSTTKTSTRTTSRTVSTRTSTPSTTQASTRTTSRTVSTRTSTRSTTQASTRTTSSALPTSSISTTSSTTTATSTTTRKRSTSKASTTSSTSVEQALAAFPLSQLGEQQSLTTIVDKKPWTSNVQLIEPSLNPANAPSEEDSTGSPSEDDSTGLLVAAVVLPVLTACLCATLGICCYRAKLRQLRGAEGEPSQVPNPLAILPPFARSVKPLIFAWESRMTAEWPRGKVQKLSVRETAFELRGREFQFQPGHLRHFAWEDGTVQTVQSIHKNVVWWRTRHPHPAWQHFRWICTPKCQVENHHDMELMASEGDGYRCTSCSRFRSAGKHWYCPQHQVHVCPACAELPPEMPTLGLAAAYLVDVFPLLARRVTNAENPDFYDICPNLAHGPAGMGYNRTCPRDGRPHCSIVDALEDAYSGKVTHFVSWCWKYSLKNVVSAIERWLQKSNEDPQNVFLWMCFFCNNQYRIKEEATQTGSDELKEIFESHLVEAGRMLVLLDTIVQPTYVMRAWCIFESYVCIAQGIPMNIILPNTAETFFREAMRAGKIELLTGAVDDLNVRHARAGSEQDEDLIKKIILTTTGFDVVNRAVRARLIDELTVLFRELFTPQPS